MGTACHDKDLAIKLFVPLASRCWQAAQTQAGFHSIPQTLGIDARYLSHPDLADAVQWPMVFDSVMATLRLLDCSWSGWSMPGIEKLERRMAGRALRELWAGLLQTPCRWVA